MIFYCFRTFRYRSGTFSYDFMLGGYATGILTYAADIFFRDKSRKKRENGVSPKPAKKV